MASCPTSSCTSCVTSLRAKGIYLWAGEDGFLAQAHLQVGEFLVFAAFAYHAFNGLRLVFVEMGFAVGKPIEPVYPYKTSSASSARSSSP